MGRFAPEVDAAEADCRGCGACCAYSAEWPRFTIEDDAELALIPAAYADDGAPGMRCDGVYAVRPQVCRDCEPGDAECRMARARHGL